MCRFCDKLDVWYVYHMLHFPMKSPESVMEGFASASSGTVRPILNLILQESVSVLVLPLFLLTNLAYVG